MQAVIDGIILKLADIDPTIEAYDEHQEQGFKGPCFFVLEVDGNQAGLIGRRFKRSSLYDIHYFPKSDVDPRKECHDIADRLYCLMESFEWGGYRYKGTNLRHQVIDNMLHFFLEVKVHLIKPKDPVPKMNTMKGEVYTDG
ncbi:DUF6838 family protein [Paenibacillus shunpengii]|uniref:DUF6838 family protein n=1 Tax=Paenibacillus shunpengii TaxID=2054424 RepID=A0ABW5SXC1_9BACL